MEDRFPVKTEETVDYNVVPRQFAFTGDFFEEWNEITPQIHIRIFEELTA